MNFICALHWCGFGFLSISNFGWIIHQLQDLEIEFFQVKIFGIQIHVPTLQKCFKAPDLRYAFSYHAVTLWFWILLFTNYCNRSVEMSKIFEKNSLLVRPSIHPRERKQPHQCNAHIKLITKIGKFESLLSKERVFDLQGKGKINNFPISKMSDKLCRGREPFLTDRHVWDTKKHPNYHCNIKIHFAIASKN